MASDIRVVEDFRAAAPALENAVAADKNWKRMVRARMAKTGEVHEYGDLAGMSDDAVGKKTGRTWPEWIEELDAFAVGLDHTAIAARVRERWPDISGWWAQTVTVGYERIRRARSVGEVCEGTFSASKSKTCAVPVAALFTAFADDAQRRAWLDVDAEVRRASPHHSVRMSLPDGTRAVAWFTDTGPAKRIGGRATREARVGRPPRPGEDPLGRAPGSAGHRVDPNARPAQVAEALRCKGAC